MIRLVSLKNNYECKRKDLSAILLIFNMRTFKYLRTIYHLFMFELQNWIFMSTCNKGFKLLYIINKMSKKAKILKNKRTKLLQLCSGYCYPLIV